MVPKNKAVIPVLSAIFVVNASMNALNISLVAISDDFAIELTHINFAYAGFLMFFAGFVLTAGKLSDILGEKRLFNYGICIFTISSILGIFAITPSQIKIICCAQGLACALLYPTGTVLLLKLYPEKKATPMALMAAIGGIAGALIPIIIGYLITNLSWRLLFAFNLLPLLMTLLFFNSMENIKSLQDSRGKKETLSKGFWIGSISSITPLLLFYYLLDAFCNNKQISTVSLILILSITAISSICFIRHCKNDSSPLINITLLKNFLFLIPISIRFITMACYISTLFFATTLFQIKFELSAFQTGVSLLPMMLALTLFSMLAGKLSNQNKLCFSLMTGLAIFFLTVIYLYLYSSLMLLYELIGVLIFLAIGLGLSTPPLGTIALSSLNDNERGTASGLMFTFNLFGALLGLTLCNIIINLKNDQIINIYIESFSETSLLNGVALLLSILISIKLLRKI